ncbi:MAG: hypothetical protein ACRD9S_05180 [Pyrinomonadaceae bacterium]
MRPISNALLLILALCVVSAAQAKPKIKYPGSTREAALRCPGAGCLGSVTASPGEQVEFWIAGSDLAKVTSIKFQPPDGIEVGKIEATEDTVHAVLTISPGAALGKRSFVVTSPAGDSNQSNGELNITSFRISNLKIESVANNNGTLTFRVTFNYSDPTGAVSSEGMNRNTSLNFTGRFIGGVGSGFKFNPEGRTQGAKAGVISFTESYDNLQGTTGAIYSISLTSQDGRESDKLQAIF